MQLNTRALNDLMHSNTYSPFKQNYCCSKQFPDENIISNSGNDSLVDVDSDSDSDDNIIQIINGDALPFELENIHTVVDLLPYVTNISEVDGNVTFEFSNGDTSITLIGVSASEITIDMTLFDLS